MDIRLPSVGPIVGRTSSTATHVFIRGDAGWGVAQYRAAGIGPWSVLNAMALDPARDLTCVFAFSGLQPGQEYEYRAGWSPVPPPSGVLPPDSDWPAEALFRFRTATAREDAERSYAIGSCRHLSSPLQPAEDPKGDEIFRSVRAQHEVRPFDAFFMLGDQIYADGVRDEPVTQKDQFHALYRCTFRHRHLRNLMARLPTYMILDDHEIQDNWPAKADPQTKQQLQDAALEAYRTYQGSHNPAADGHLWYTFRDGCADWFVMDTRSQRDLQAGRMVDEEQLQALLAFLADGSGRVKLVATTVPIFPDHAFYADDKWQGFPAQRREIFDCIRRHQVRRVVFVSGDVHCSFVAKLALDARTTVHTVVSSPFVSWVPFAAVWRWSFWRQLVDAGTSARPELLSDTIFWSDSFARLVVGPRQAVVSFYNRRGKPLQEGIAIALA